MKDKKSNSFLTTRIVSAEWKKWIDHKETFQPLSDFINDPRYTTGQLPVSYRVLNHWEKAGVLPQNTDTRSSSWRKFAYVDMVWIEIASNLRNFGFPLEKIVKVKEQIFHLSERLKMYVMFEYFIALATYTSSDAYVIVLSDGSADMGTLEEIRVNQLKGDMLLISFKGILQKVGITSDELAEYSRIFKEANDKSQ